MGDTGNWLDLKAKYAIEAENDGVNIKNFYDHSQITLVFDNKGTEEILLYLKEAITNPQCDTKYSRDIKAKMLIAEGNYDADDVKFRLARAKRTAVSQAHLYA